MTIPFVNSFRNALQRNPRLVGVVIGLVFLAWTALIGYSFFLSVPPSESDIASQSVQLNAAKLQTVTEHLTKYRVTSDVPALRDDLFTSPKP